MCVCVYVSVETIWNVVAFYTSGGSFRMTLRSDMSRSWAEDAIASDGKASELLQKLRLSRRSEKRRRKTKDEDEGDVFLLNLPKYPPFCVFSKNSQNAPPIFHKIERDTYLTMYFQIITKIPLVFSHGWIWLSFSIVSRAHENSWWSLVGGGYSLRIVCIVHVTWHHETLISLGDTCLDQYAIILPMIFVLCLVDCIESIAYGLFGLSNVLMCLSHVSSGIVLLGVALGN